MITHEQIPEAVAHAAEAEWSKGATWKEVVTAAMNAWPEACSARDDFIAMSDEGPWLILPIQEPRDE